MTNKEAQVRFCAKRAPIDLAEVTITLASGDLIEAKQSLRYEFIDLIGTIGNYFFCSR